MPDDDVLGVSKVSDKGLITIPLEIRRKLGLTPGTKMVIMATEDAVVLRKGVMLFAKEPPAVFVEEDPRDVLHGANREHGGMRLIRTCKIIGLEAAQ